MAIPQGLLVRVWGGLIGGIVGLLGGPFISAMGAAGGVLSGGWFDLIRVEEREMYLSEIAQNILANRAALLAEVISPSDVAKETVETRMLELGGSIVGRGA